VEESARRVTKEWSELSTKYIDPFIRSAGHVPKETFIQHAINHQELLFVTDYPSLLQERNRSFFTKDRIEGLLTASWQILKRDPDALVGGQEDIILVYASNHRDEIRQLLGDDAPDDWNDFPVRSILRNMGVNGGREAQSRLTAALGDEGYSRFMADKSRLTAALGDEGYSRFMADKGAKGGLATAQRAMIENINKGKPVHVIKCTSSAGERGCAGKTWSLGSPTPHGYIYSSCQQCMKAKNWKQPIHHQWGKIGRALNQDEVLKAFELRRAEKTLARNAPEYLE